MKDLQSSIRNCLKDYKTGSFGTRARRTETLNNLEKDLKECGYKNVNTSNISVKHVRKLTDHWKNKGNSDATIKNKLSHVRWYFNKIDRGHTLPKTNSTKHLKIDNRESKPNDVQTAKQLSDYKGFDKLTEREQTVLKMQRAFGLRREESLKIQPSKADKGDNLALNKSWCKGGRYREVPIRTQEQRDILNKAKEIAGKGSMIEKDQSYIQAAQNLEKKLQYNDMPAHHGLRHAYAQERYEQLTGNKCPRAGGLSRKDMTAEQKLVDHNARMDISKELGHSRIDVTVSYLGS